jgi:crotonobetaine/carnitine-CoA ligase
MDVALPTEAGGASSVPHVITHFLDSSRMPAMMSPLGVLQHYRAHDGSLHDAFESRRAVRADAPFVVQDGRTLSWAQFGDAYARLAVALATRGTRRGDRVAVIARNDVGHLLALFALARLGAILVPINPEFGARELRYALELTEPVGVIVQQGVRHVLDDALDALPVEPWILDLDGEPTHPDSLQGVLAAADASAALEQTGSSADTCVIIFTSGTTGHPKGVMHSQSNLVTAGEANLMRVHLQPDDRVMIVLPFFHVNALFYSTGGVLACGGCAVLVPRFSASTFWQVAADSGATVVNIIEAIGSILCARPRSEFRADHRIRVAYGVRKASAPTFREVFKVAHLVSGFGMTEVPGVTCTPYEGTEKEGSMGVLGLHPDPSRPWAQCRIVDDDGADVATGETGELLVSTPILMQGYFRDPEQTANAVRDGWMITGDLVRRDADGYYYHLSRKKDVIRRRGENIAAAELEMVIGGHPGVAEVAAIAVPSELGEDDIFVVAKARQDAVLTADDITEWCRSRLAPVKLPRYVAFIDALPYTPTHKIAKAVLRSDAALFARAVDMQAPSPTMRPAEPRGGPA